MNIDTTLGDKKIEHHDDRGYLNSIEDIYFLRSLLQTELIEIQAIRPSRWISFLNRLKIVKTAIASSYIWINYWVGKKVINDFSRFEQFADIDTLIMQV